MTGSYTINYISNVVFLYVRCRPPPDGMLPLYFISQLFLKRGFFYCAVLEIYFFNGVNSNQEYVGSNFIIINKFERMQNEVMAA
jgi:hypothetical protein